MCFPLLFDFNWNIRNQKLSLRIFFYLYWLINGFVKWYIELGLLIVAKDQMLPFLLGYFMRYEKYPS